MVTKSQHKSGQRVTCEEQGTNADLNLRKKYDMRAEPMSPSSASEPRKRVHFQFQGGSKAQLWDGDPRIQKDGYPLSIISRPFLFIPAVIGELTVSGSYPDVGRVGHLLSDTKREMRGWTMH